MQPYFKMIFVYNSFTTNYILCTILKNFDKFYEIVKSSLQLKLNDYDKLQFYFNKPKMNDCSIIALSICTEAIGIDSENYLWSKIIKDYKADFPLLVDKSNFNKRRRRLR